MGGQKFLSIGYWLVGVLANGERVEWSGMEWSVIVLCYAESKEGREGRVGILQ